VRQNLQGTGLAEALTEDAATLPELSAAAEQAVHCWAWCEGWAPERWPHYAAFHAVADWHHHMSLLTVLRNALNQAT